LYYKYAVTNKLEMWLSDQCCIEIVEATWSHHDFGTNDSNILRRVESCGK